MLILIPKGEPIGIYKVSYNSCLSGLVRESWTKNLIVDP